MSILVSMILVRGTPLSIVDPIGLHVRVRVTQKWPWEVTMRVYNK
jgi:hypothetical protein